MRSPTLASMIAAALLASSFIALPAFAQDNTTAGTPTYASDCEQQSAEVQAQMDRFQAEQNDRRNVFYADQNRQREEFSRGNHTEEEWRAFDAELSRQSQDFESRLSAEAETYHKQLWSDYESRCGYSSGGGGSGTYDGQVPTTSGGTTYSDEPAECREKPVEVEEQLHNVFTSWEGRHRAFQEEFDAARRSLSSSDHTKEEWMAFSNEWSAKAQSMFESMKAEILGILESHGLSACAQYVSQYMVFEYPHEEAGSMQGPEALPAYTRPRMDPELEARMKEIQARCESKMQTLMRERENEWRSSGDQPMPTYDPPPQDAPTASTSDGSYDGGAADTAPSGQYPDGTTSGDYGDGSGAVYGSSSHPAWDSEFEARMREIQRQCEAEMRALFEEHEEREFENYRERAGSFTMYWDEESGRMVVEGKHLKLWGVPEAQMMVDITVSGQKWVDRLFVNGYLAEFRPEETREGTALRITDSNGQRILAIHDNPRGVINLATSAEVGSITLDLADYLEVEVAANGVRFTDGEVSGAVNGHGIELGEGNELTITGKATFLVGRGSDLSAEAKQAALDGDLGAEVIISKEDGDLSTDATPYGDLEVEVSEESEGKVSALIDSEEGTGKTVVLKFDESYFDSIDLEVLAAEVDEDGTESALAVREADDLEDVLDPFDDGEAVEYWIVQDKYGIQVLASIPHFSLKKITVEGDSPAEKIVGWVPAPGIAVVLTVIGLGALAARRRKDSDE